MSKVGYALVWFVGFACLLAFGWWMFSVASSPVYAVTFTNPRPVHVQEAEGYRVVTYVEGCGPYPGAPLSLSFTASPIEYTLYRLGVLEWTVWEPL